MFHLQQRCEAWHQDVLHLGEYVSKEVQGVLLGDLLVLLQKQDDKRLLKGRSESIIAALDGKQMLSPTIKLDSAFLREVATGV
ncbi:hypothetical protein MHYP_G00289120 [Metynnis hypsauchen]